MKINRQTHARGSVLVLVVATLGLLVVIGTVYVLTSRLERNNANTMSTVVNADLARDAVMSQVQQTIGGSMIDNNGQVGGYGSGATPTAARNYDYPEYGSTFGQAASNAKMKDEPWLVAHLHPQASYPSPVAGTNDMTVLTAQPYDPAMGTYTGGLTYSTFPNPSALGISELLTVVGDQTSNTIDTTPDDPPKPYADAFMNLLPYSEASGIHYRFGLRIIDTNRMANLNTGSPVDATSTPDTTGTYLTSLRLAPSSGWPPTNAYFQTGDSGTAVNLQNESTNNLGRTAIGYSDTTFNQYPQSLSTWQQQILNIEQPSNKYLALFDLSEELELRSYGEFGTAYHLRSGSQNAIATRIFPNTLSADSTRVGAPTGIVAGNPSRRNYTTYSFSRDIRPYPDPSTKFTFNGSLIPTPPWPTAPAKVSLNCMTSVGPSTTLLGQLAASLATVMTNTGNTSPMYASTNTSIPAFTGATTAFTQDEICAFVANFLTQTWNGAIPDAAAGNGLYLPAGPSFVDSQGMCIRTANAGVVVTTNVDFVDAGTGVRGTGTNVYLGYSAQPFINEVAVYANTDGGMPPTLTVNDFAVELFNPYTKPLSLRGWHLKVAGTAVDVTLDGKYVPAQGFLVVGFSTHFTAGVPAGVQTLASQTTLPNGTSPVAGVIGLYRPYYPRGQAGGAASLAEVDAMDYSQLVNNPAIWTTFAKDQSVSRQNISTTSPWGCAIDAATLTTSSIGLINSGTATGTVLYDRFAGTPDNATIASQPTVGTATFSNINDFNQIMRIGHIIDPSTGQAITNGLLGDHLQMLSNSAPYAAMQFPVEAQIHFDFMAAPSIYTTSPPSEPSAPVSPPYQGDIRAVRFVDQVTLLDRVSDTTIDVGGGPNDINKIRLPGQINVNTASGDVLRALPGLADSTNPQLSGNMPNQIVANILAYRNRRPVNSNDPLASYAGIAATTDYSDNGASGKYPGFGIRSLGELMIPVNDALATAAPAPTTLWKRDRVWASFYNLCTVRSDTFAVYGYMEAVKQNPAYTTFNNGSDWYTASNNAIYTTSSTIDDPHNAGPLIRVARRRWVAIVDRSFSNYAAGTANFSLPRVVAIKDLPQ